MSDEPRRDEPGSVDTVTIGVPTGEIALPVMGADEIVVEAEPRLPGRTLGVAALVAATLVVIATTTGIALATDDAYQTATPVAWAAIGASALAVVLGILAIGLRRGRGWGAAAVVVALIANPYLLRAILAAVGGPAVA